MPSKRYALKDVTKELADVAMGRKPAQTVIQNGNLVNVNTGEIQWGVDVAISHGRIALVGDASHTIGCGTAVVDAAGLYVTPGFMDGHIHVESSMMTVREYAKTVVPHGTTAIFADPHEIANVCGPKGVAFMLEDGRDVPMRFYVAMPSCVPAVDAFEDTAARIAPEDVKAFMTDPDVRGLGEMMNFPGVLAGDDNMHRELYETLDQNKTITGHYAMPETGRGLNAYIASGVRCCHESTRKEDALAKMRFGMYVQVREGSAWHDLKEVIRAVTEERIDTRFCTLVSDDTHSDTLLNLGHLDHIVKRAIEEGVNPIAAIQMVTLNVAQCFGMDRDLGAVSPGKWADILLLSDLTKVKVETVFVNGELVAQNGGMTVDVPSSRFPDWVTGSMHLKAPLKPEDFPIAAPEGKTGTVKTKVIEIIEAKVGTYERHFDLEIQDGLVRPDVNRDIIYAAVIERHKQTGTMGKGFVTGFGLKRGAVASTVAHDAHNLMIVGTDPVDMAFAGNMLAECGGGMVAVENGKVIAILPLPVAGLMCELSAQEIAEAVERLDAAWKTLGCTLISPFMTMALLALGVLPELRLTNRGLVDTMKYEMTGMFLDIEKLHYKQQ